MAIKQKFSLDELTNKISSNATPLTKFLRCGVYFLVDKGKINYVGQSSCIESRVHSHRETRVVPFDSVYVIETRSDKLLIMEAYFIEKLKPPYNYTRPCAELLLRQAEGKKRMQIGSETLIGLSTPGKTKRKNLSKNGVVTPLGFFPTIKWAAEEHKVSPALVYARISDGSPGWSIFCENRFYDEAERKLAKMRGRPLKGYESIGNFLVQN